MYSTTELKEYAQLSEAAYAFFDSSDFSLKGGGGQSLWRNLTEIPNQGASFSARQAEEFASQFDVLHQSDPANQGAGGDGFSATLFRDKNNEKIVLAFRGTEFKNDNIPDLLTDLRIGVDGYASIQAISEFRYIKQLMTVGGQSVGYSEDELNNLKNVYFDYTARTLDSELQWEAIETSIRADKGIDAGQGNHALIGNIDQLSLTGHSLGGHLAVLATRLFPNLAAVPVVTVNAPGFFSQSEIVLSGFSTRPESNNITHVESVGDIVSELGNYFPGTAFTVGMESSLKIGDSLDNHSVANVADGLKLTEIFGKLDIRYAADARLIRPLFDASSNLPINTYEHLFDSLRMTLLGPNQANVTVETAGNPATRNDLYVQMAALEASEEFKALTGKLTIQAFNIDDSKRARTVFSSLIALVNLSPFTVKGIDADAQAKLDILIATAWTNSSLLKQWQDDAELTESQREAGEANFSDAYLADRAKFLGVLIEANRTNSEWIPNSSKEEWIYKDQASNQTVALEPNDGSIPSLTHLISFGDFHADNLNGGTGSDSLYGGDGYDVLKGLAGNDYIEGNAGDDRLDGGEGNDKLLGGEGNDTLNGGKGDDLLQGGAGHDQYVFNDGDGFDTIIDADGSIVINGKPVTSGAWLSPTVWKDFTNKIMFTKQGNDLLIVSSGGKILVKNFQNNQLGISLGNFNAEQPGTSDQTIVGDFQHFDSDPNLDGIQPIYDALGNEIQDKSKPDSSFADSLLGSGGNDLILSGGGNDVVYGKGGNDQIYGGGGQDTLVGDDGDDRIFGEDGNDLIAGNIGADYLSGGAGNDELHGGDGDDTLSLGGGRDLAFGEDGDDALIATDIPNAAIENAFLDGGRGDDDLVGASGNDVLLGGRGKDFLSGGAGNDLLLGDVTGFNVKSNWSVSFPSVAGGGYTLEHWNYDIKDGAVVPDPDKPGYFTFDLGEGEDDLIDGGDGDDRIHGGGGNDTLFGGGGNDKAYGGIGDDSLLGGAGNDTLTGQLGNDFLDGGGDDDSLFGEEGEDILIGGIGNDYLSGGMQADSLWGGIGNDMLQGDGASADGDDLLFGEEGDDTLVGGGANDTLDGGEGNDQLFGDATDLPSARHGNDLLIGGNGDDYLAGGSGNDTLQGGRDTDFLEGGEGDDTYLFERGDSNPNAIGEVDVISDDKGQNVVVLNGVSRADVTADFDQSGKFLYVRYSETDELIVENGGAGSVARYKLSDGTDLDYRQFIGQFSASAFSGTDAQGKSYAVGGTNSDYLNVNSGRTNFSGGRGNDWIVGNGGNNSYYYNVGDGLDDITDLSSKFDSFGNAQLNRIVFGAGISRQDIRLTLDNGTLTLNMGSEGQDAIRLQEFDVGENLSSPPIDWFEFNDGTKISYKELISQGFNGTESDDVMMASPYADRVSGLSGNDAIWGRGGNDTLDGGMGDDTLYGGAGNDHFYFGKGDGHDHLVMEEGAASQLDQLKFKEGIDPASVKVTRSVNSIIFTLLDSGESVSVDGFFDRYRPFDSNLPLFSVAFSGGQQWDVPEILNRLQISQAETTSSATLSDDEIKGKDGNDIIFGGAGWDSINCVDNYNSSNGFDIVYGESGSDFIAANGLVYGGDGDDFIAGSGYLDGGNGNDHLGSGWNHGEIVFRGGNGNDTIKAGWDSNTFVFGVGGGRDVIEFGGGSNYKPKNWIKFEGALRPGDIEIIRTNGSSYVSIIGTNDQIQVDLSEVNGFIFDDGTIAESHGALGDGFAYLHGFKVKRIEESELLGSQIDVWESGSSHTIFGSNNNDQVVGSGVGDRVSLGSGDDVFLGGYGGEGQDTIFAGSGNDTVLGYGGGDIIEGGQGDDLMSAGGNAVYLYSRGDGDDLIKGGLESNMEFEPVIRFAQGITPEDVFVHRSMGYFSNLILKLNSEGDLITIENFFGNFSDIPQKMNESAAVKRVEFNDGTVWDIPRLIELAGVNEVPVFNGTNGSDILVVSSDAGYVSALAGNDSILGSIGNDTIYAGDGDDVIQAGQGNDLIVAGLGNNVFIYGKGDGQDTIKSFFDADVNKNSEIRFSQGILASDVKVTRADVFLDYSKSSVLLSIGDSDSILISDYFVGANSPVQTITFSNGVIWKYEDVIRASLIGDASDQFMIGTSGDDTVFAGGGNDTIEGGGGFDAIFGEDGDDNIFSSGSTTLGSMGKNITLSGGNGNDVITAENGNVTILGDDGDDQIKGANGVYYGNGPLRSFSAASAISGTLGDYLDGGSGNDWIQGNGGDDTLIGGTGDDSLEGGEGADTYIFRKGDGVDSIVDNNSSGANSLEFTDYNRTDISAITREGADLRINLQNGDSVLITAYFDQLENYGDRVLNEVQFANGEKIALQDLLSADGVQLSVGDDNFSFSNVINKVFGLAGNDVISGASQSDTLDGGAGEDTLYGNNGDDILIGGTGNDYLDGGAGSDTYEVDSIGDVVIESTNSGLDLIKSSISYNLGSDVENLTLTGTAAINGTGNTLENILIGNAAANTLTGGAGNDFLDGGAGKDTLIGGVGNDTYIVNIATDVVTELAGEGIDTVQSSISWTLGANVENLILSGTAVSNAIGNALDNILIGNSNSNSLRGGAGNDTLDGGLGTDYMSGGTGNDTYIVSASTDVTTELADEGIDTVQSSVTRTLGVNLENLELTGTSAIRGTGNELNNTLTGNSANNTLDGGLGNDTLLGGVGNDIYVVDSVGDSVIENADAGLDLVQASVSFGLSANVEDLTLTGTNAIDGIGNSLGNTLIGNAAANRLTGGAGNDVLNGGASGDALSGGTGDDRYIVDDTTDVVTELKGEGVDTVESSVTWTLGNEVENLTLIGTAAINGTGNSLDNILIGNRAANTLVGGSGNDTLNGGAGSDVLVGGSGDDTYVVDVYTDVVTELVNQGIDTIQSSTNWTLAADIENLILTGIAGIKGNGNSLNNVITGNSGANTINAGAGNDTLSGGAGNDTINGGTGNDRYLFGRGDGIDALTDSDATVGNADVLQLSSDVASNQLWFQHVGNNLEISIIGTGDKTVVQNWYSGSANHIEQIKSGDGKVLLDSQVDALVSAMAGFNPPAAGQISLNQQQQDALQPVLAASWH